MKDKKALVGYIASVLLFGSNGIVASHISCASYEIVFLRTLIGSVALVALFFIGRGKWHITASPRDALFVALSGVAMAGNWLTLYEAYDEIGVGLATLFCYCGPVIVMMLSPVLFHEKLTMPKVVGFVVVLIGVTLISLRSLSGGGSVWGFVCGGLCAVSYALMVILNKKSTHITGLENSAIQLTCGFVTLALFLLIRQGGAIHTVAADWPWIALLGVVNTGVGCFLYFSAFSRLPVQTVAILGYLEPLSALFLSWILLGERLSLVEWIGAACIMGGAMAGEMIGKKGTAEEK